MQEVDIKDLVRAANEETERAYHDLESLCICFPGRVTGSTTLEKALDFLLKLGQTFLPEDQCHEEVVASVPNWRRGDWRESSLTLTIHPDPTAFPEPFPLVREVPVRANALSVGTPSEGLEAEVVVVHSFDALERLGVAGQLRDKIVLYDYQHFTCYEDVSPFLEDGAARAAEYGALAALIRSITPDGSLSGVHTGCQDEAAIPGACISIETCEEVRRLVARGHHVSARLVLGCEEGPRATSRNLVFDLRGSEEPHKVVLLGAHVDSWESHGAHDDGQGAVLGLALLRLLCQHGWQPRRTIRVVLYTDEEIDSSGAMAYHEAHLNESENLLVAIETDLGIGPVAGFGSAASEPAQAFFRENLVPALRSALGNDEIDVSEEWDGYGEDTAPLVEEQEVPGLLLRHSDIWAEFGYFHFHHTCHDTIDKIDKGKLRDNLAALLVAVWVLANSEEPVPRG
eukprot:gene10359-11469_t